MLRIQAFEESCLVLSQQGLAAGSMRLCAGQEAILQAALLPGAEAVVVAANELVRGARG
jgi:TPP-dependent pyruvate/acetoin dehydrogenase alpha subunit